MQLFPLHSDLDINYVLLLPKSHLSLWTHSARMLSKKGQNILLRRFILSHRLCFKNKTYNLMKVPHTAWRVMFSNLDRVVGEVGFICLFAFFKITFNVLWPNAGHYVNNTEDIGPTAIWSLFQDKINTKKLRYGMVLLKVFYQHAPKSRGR